MNEMGEFDCPSIMAEVFASVSTARYLSVLHANSTYPLKSSRSSSPLRFYRSSVKSYHSSSDVAIVEDVNNRGSREYAEFWAARALVDSKLVLSNDRLCDITTHCGTPYQTSRALRFYCVIGDRNFVPYASSLDIRPFKVHLMGAREEDGQFSPDLEPGGTQSRPLQRIETCGLLPVNVQAGEQHRQRSCERFSNPRCARLR